MKSRGAIACGHGCTAAAAEEILRDGGNAFDAVIAAHFTACVAEPVLTSLGGGGFLLAHTAAGNSHIYDFFAQTPTQQRNVEEQVFFPISADFGNARQEFHIGPGAIACPGTVRGLFTIHRELGSLPMHRLLEPAIRAAREGVTVNAFQAYIFSIVKPIFSATTEARRIYSSQVCPGELVQEGEHLYQNQLADSLELLATEGERAFYIGDIAQAIVRLCQQGGGHLAEVDLTNYQVIRRSPLELSYHGARLITNPPPSSGGMLIAFALKLLEATEPRSQKQANSASLQLLAEVMALTNKARLDTYCEVDPKHPQLDILDPAYLHNYREHIKGRAQSLRGTTHISVMDGRGNIASLTTSNGEGCGHIVPGTGIMLNNMLGEEDLNPQGFQHWQCNQRMSSMMAPSTVYLADKSWVSLGSGGSNRLRTAILQVLIKLIDYALPLEDAVSQPRIHYENQLLSIEPGLTAQQLAGLQHDFPGFKQWDKRNLFFGGVHSVQKHPERFVAAGDPRRGGVGIVLE